MRFLPFFLIIIFVQFAFSQSATSDVSVFVEAGIPALSREWSGPDYVRAAEILSAGKVPLPRLSDENGRLFFKRLTATENFSFYRSRTIPAEARVDNFFKLIRGANAIMKLYMTAAMRDQQFHGELAQQMAFVLRATAIGVRLLDEYIPTLPKDEKYSVRMNGLKQTYDGLTRVFVGAEASLSERSFYSSEDLSLLLRAMAEAVPTVKNAFSPDFKVEFRKKLEARRAAFPTKHDAQNIQRIIDELRR